MKKAITFTYLVVLFSFGTAQVKKEDFGRIVLNTVIPDDLKLPQEAKQALQNKLNQISSHYAMGGSQANPRFIITANISVGTKDIIPGPPQLISQQLEATIYVGDAETSTLFASKSYSLKGVGTNENKAFIEAFKNINPKDSQTANFIDAVKSKILSFYNEQCDFIIKQAQSLAKQQKYDEAIYELTLVPEVCKSCYFRCLDTLQVIYQKKIDVDGQAKLNKAKALWAADPTKTGAEKAGAELSSINAEVACRAGVDSLIKTIELKLRADEKEQWKLMIKQYEDNVALQKEQMRIAEAHAKRDDKYREKEANRNFELDRLRINAYREVALERARNQPKTVTYNNVYWR